MGKPDVDLIEGLSPAISIEQKTTSKNPRSTVGTVTEIHDYMRLLWARVGVPYSPVPGLPIERRLFAGEVVRGIEQCRDGRRTGRLDDDLGPLHQRQEGGRQRLLGDGTDLVHVLLDRRERHLARAAYGDPVSHRRHRCKRHRPAAA